MGGITAIRYDKKKEYIHINRNINYKNVLSIIRADLLRRLARPSPPDIHKNFLREHFRPRSGSTRTTPDHRGPWLRSSELWRPIFVYAA